ncbi:MAG: hypothetical protein A3E84_01030 [Gammaproteobacteria bacterium RIFCSPHIGHO2_12_FULL_42_13]|nr:MAG: hypothetical protein A3E84_01030 [Gammaproteobacteria bacterium RIFCSPHIGHO2_12_FULL_42_13]
MNHTYLFTLSIFVILLIWIPRVWRYKISPYFAKRSLIEKLSNHSNRTNIKVTEQLLTTLYAGVKSESISRHERKRLNLEEDAFIYGEVDFLSFITILDKAQPQSGDVFYDLGCGAGKAIFTAALAFDLSKSIGIELLPRLCELANKQIIKSKSLVKSHYKEAANTFLLKLSCIEIINDDILNCDISKGNIIFINATCFNYHAWGKIVGKLQSLSEGCRVIVTTKQIQNDHFQLLNESRELMSWGMNSVRIYKKTSVIENPVFLKR